MTRLDSLTLEEHGVDGSKIYVYGEGWNFGEVENGARGENATQLKCRRPPGIGTFNDRIRDAVRGGNPFGGYQEQGFATGLYYDTNEVDTRSEDQQLETVSATSWTRFGLPWPQIWPTITLSDATGQGGGWQRSRLQRLRPPDIPPAPKNTSSTSPPTTTKPGLTQFSTRCQHGDSYGRPGKGSKSGFERCHVQPGCALLPRRERYAPLEIL